MGLPGTLGMLLSPPPSPFSVKGATGCETFSVSERALCGITTSLHIKHYGDLVHYNAFKTIITIQRSVLDYKLLRTILKWLAEMAHLFILH